MQSHNYKPHIYPYLGDKYYRFLTPPPGFGNQIYLCFNCFNETDIVAVGSDQAEVYFTINTGSNSKLCCRLNSVPNESVLEGCREDAAFTVNLKPMTMTEYVLALENNAPE